MKQLAILSVHYRFPELLHDAIARLQACAGPVRESLGAELRYYATIHRYARDGADEVVAERCRSSQGFATCVDLRDRPPEVIPKGGRCHGHSLAEAYRVLRRDGRLADDDLIVSLDHDAHPLHSGLFALLGEELLGADGLAGIGIPQWHRGHCFLHPSLLMTRVRDVDEMGPQAAFEVQLPVDPQDETWSDTCEGFTLWCEQHRRPIRPLRVESTHFPWVKWDSVNTERWEATELTGCHGEPVHVGCLMRYGLEPGVPLVSHLWAGPVTSFLWMGFSAHKWEEIRAAYLAEPLS
jgi:hypothetical protein